MSPPHQFLIEGLDRLGKDTLICNIQHSLGYHLVLHYKKPEKLNCYMPALALRHYQEASFRTMFQLLRGAPEAKIICNRAHLGECVYAPMYRKYEGKYVFVIEREYNAHELPYTRLILLTEDFSLSKHFLDDNQGLGGPEKRQEEQNMFLQAFDSSTILDKRRICVTDPITGNFKAPESILDEALRP